MLIAAAMEIESILVTGPLLTIIGLLFATVTRRIGSIAVLVYGLSGPLMCALCAGLIAYYSWGPEPSRRPINSIIVAYTALIAPVAIGTFYRIRRFPAQSYARQPYAWRYSLKSMLVVMTAVCVLIAATQTLMRLVPRGESLIFGGYALVCVTLSAIVVWRFVAANGLPPGSRMPETFRNV